MLQRPPFQLSAGEKQRVCLAALLVLEPEVVLFDEPTASLDPRTTGWLIDFLQDLSLTTVVTTHNLSLAAELGGRTLALSEDHRLILDGTVVRARLDKKATTICLLVVLGVREDGQKVLLAVKNMGGETAQAWRVVLDDLIKRGLRKPEFLIIDGGSGPERALAEIWSDVPTQRCTVHKHRNLLTHAPERLPEMARLQFPANPATPPLQIHETHSVSVIRILFVVRYCVARLPMPIV